MKKILLFLAVVVCVPQVQAQTLLLQTLKSEADRNLAELKKQEVPAYYINYRVWDNTVRYISASFGNLLESVDVRQRIFNAAVRVGTPELDNTHEIKEGNEPDYADYNYSGHGNLGLEDNPAAWRLTLWEKTDQVYVAATKRYQKVKANMAVKVSSTDKSSDFTIEKPERYVEQQALKIDNFDVKAWEEKAKKFSALFKENKDIIEARFTLEVSLQHKYFVDTEGAEIFENRLCYFMNLHASAKAADGMELPLYKSYFAYELKNLPSDEQINADACGSAKPCRNCVPRR